MRTKLALLAAVAATLAGVAPADALPTKPEGIGCGYSYVFNPGVGGDLFLVLKGGPMAGPVVPGGTYAPDPSLACTFTIDREGYPVQTFSYASTNVAGVAVVPPTVQPVTVGNGSTDRRVDTICQTLSWTDPVTGEARSESGCRARYYNYHPELP